MSATTAPRNWVLPMCALLFATFAICTAELIVAGLLPAVATDLGVSIPVAGLLITGYAIGVAVTGPVLSLFTGRFTRKTLLVAIMAIYIVGNLLCAIATSYWTLLGARLVLSTCHGVHFGAAMVLASQLAPPGRQSTAISIVIAGVSAAIILGVPIGTAIGNAYGWRTPFWAAAVIGLVATIILVWLVPATTTPGAQSSELKAQLRAAVRPVALLCYTTFALLLTILFIINAYIVPFLTDGGGVTLELVPWILLGIGIASFIGTLLGGPLGDRKPAATMIIVFTLLVVLTVLLAQFASDGRLVSVLLFLIWVSGFSVASSLQTRLLREVSDAPNFASTLMNTASQVGIASGAALGGLVLSAGWSYGQLPLLSAGFAGFALAGVLTLVSYDRRREAAAGLKVCNHYDESPTEPSLADF